ncbi:hypothetical protein E1B28_012855 [Marasmius oreades]|uniref:Uncharacterized protein n=1 Tax=Marasmius oreades TaxID=181124 RepID=A0A9P7UPE2_9AGAR|nr:uncharacterized protein E1B28_012855 [Marasmius oreades]KAG7088910.1 hypothetical protein E1B28_012855 [Marasmius oreades]
MTTGGLRTVNDSEGAILVTTSGVFGLPAVRPDLRILAAVLVGGMTRLRTGRKLQVQQYQSGLV